MSKTSSSNPIHQKILYGNKNYKLTLSERKKRDHEAATRNANIQQQIQQYKERLQTQLKGQLIDFLQEIHTLVFSGGGVLGTGFLGALSACIDYGLVLKDIKKYAGVSAGSICAALLAVGYSPSELYEVLEHCDFSQLVKVQWTRVSKIACSCLAHSEVGINSGDRLYRWMGQLIAKKTGNAKLTFQQLKSKYHKDLIIVATAVDSFEKMLLCARNYPEMEIALAVRASSSIPGIYEPVEYGNHLLVDGGLLDNYPLDVVTPSHQVLGFRITDKANMERELRAEFVEGLAIVDAETFETRRHRILEEAGILQDMEGIDKYGSDDGRYSFLNRVVSCMMWELERLQIYRNIKGRTIYVNSGKYSFLQLKLTKEEKMELFLLGYRSCLCSLQLIMEMQPDLLRLGACSFRVDFQQTTNGLESTESSSLTLPVIEEENEQVAFIK
ncbi:hypothetical protein GpartN1_g3035.t1 [Galdieria partita]|uniref:PNPLA domain-containing protein n=1 Tax=Galdieria partita TaxID=83374 RepID=A0A9C7UPT3_9RHOD|nr:hypothetical protein GpartN1_g3035.t1 [Galdieria partita]